MKKRIYSQLITSCKYLMVGLTGILFASAVSAQVLAVYPLTSKVTPNNGAFSVNPNINAGNETNGSNIDGSFNSSGTRIKTSTAWPGAPTDVTYTISFPLSGKPGNDVHLTGIQFTDSITSGSTWNNSETITVQPAYQIDGTGSWIPLGNPVSVSVASTGTVLVFPNVNDEFYSGHNYVISFFFYTTTGATKSDNFRITDVVFSGTTSSPVATAGTVTTSSATATGKYTATLKGVYDFGNQFYLATKSGMIWSTSSANLTTALATKTTDGANGVISDNITGLSAGTQYYAVAYIVTQFGTQYGKVVPFTTAPPAPPTVGLVVTQTFSNKAAVTGSIIDSGGLVISEKGFVWSTTANPTITTNKGKLNEGGGTASFSDFIKGLLPNTTYHIRAYAINTTGALGGINYSNDTTITTGAAVPTLTAVPGIIAFGPNYYNDNALVLSYTLTGSILDGTPITITAPPGFIISTKPGTFVTTTGNTITLTTANTPTYSGGTLSPTPIYVKMPTAPYGTFSGNIVHGGGGVAAGNADLVALTGSVVQSPIDVSNTGSDFWLGFAFEQNMKSNVDPYPPYSGSGANAYVYISGAPGTLVTVEMPLLSPAFSQTVTIPASGFTSVTGFPQGDPADETNAAGLADARLYYTGVTNRGIHVYSHSGPISVWLYDYAKNNSAAGALIYPTNTWNSNYTVQSYGNSTNTGPPNSFFFVIANQDNTPVYFTPVVDVVDSSTCAAFSKNAPVVMYPAGVTQTIYLNKGQVFNAMGIVNGGQTGTGADLSGTVVRTDCDKKIAVFGGNGRCLVTTPQTPAATSGSDNMVQQMTPSVAWDTKYFSVPTKSMAHNLYRIYVHNAATKVWINDTAHVTAPLTGLVSPGNYYVYESSWPTLFESDQPMSITQFMISNPSNALAIGNNGSGDPEMIILTGAQQAITNATVYSPMIQDGSSGGAYINIVIPHAGISSFKLDNLVTVDTGSSSFSGAAYASAPLIPIANAFKPYPSDTGYYYATFHVGNGTAGAVHTMSSAVPFNGIAYGCASGESYGFNAGTAVKNLSSVQFTDNPGGHDSSATAVKTCVNNPVRLKIAVPFNPILVSKVTWNPQKDGRISSPDLPLPGNDSIAGVMNGANPKYDSIIVINGRSFYVYSSPVRYTFNQNGTYRFPVQFYGTFASDCPGEDIENMLIIVGHDQSNLTYSASCGNPLVTFFTDTIPMAGTNIIKTIFDFGEGAPQINGKIDSVGHTYTANQAYTAKFTSYNSVGCISTDSVLVDFSGGLKADYTTSTNAVCAGSSITFTDNSVASGISGHPIKWIWDFGDGNKDSITGTTVSHTYNTAGKYATNLTVRTDAGCIDQTKNDTVAIQGTPIAAFTATEACLGSVTTFTDNSNVPNNLGTIDSSFFDFGDGTPHHDSLYAKTISHVYAAAGTYKVYLYVKSDGGCISKTDSLNVTVDALPVAGFKIDVNCVTDVVTFTDTSNANGGTIAEWDWDFGDNSTLITTSDSIIHHFYSNGNGQTYTVNLTVKTKAGCSSTAPSQSFGIGAAPVAQFSVAPGTYCLPNASVTFVNTSSISDGTTNQMSYVWNFDDGGLNGSSGPATDSVVTAGPPAAATLHAYLQTGPYNVTLTAISNKGCTNSVVVPLSTINPQPVATITPNPASTCLSDSLQLFGSAAAQWNWDFGDAKGTNNVDQNPKYKWGAAGKYGVSLTVTSVAGCKSVPVIDSVTVNDLPVASYTVQTLPLCAENSISFTDASTTPAGSTITEWHWDFGDGSASTSQSPTHTFAVANTYTVTLTIKNSNGCSSVVYSSPVTVHPLPVVNFSIAPICLPNPAQFTDLSSVADGTGIAQYTWDFGDGASAPGGPNNSHAYATGGIYPVKLTVVSGYGCQNDTTINDTAYNIPTAHDSILNDTALCSNQPVTLLNESIVNGYGSISKVEIYWDYVNHPTPDTTDTAPTPNGKYLHNYPALSTDNSYQVRIAAYSGNGCPNTPFDTTITVHGSPDAQFAPLNPVCQELAPFLLTGGSDISGLTGTGSYSGQGVLGDSAFSPADAGPGGPYPIVYTYTSTNGCFDTAMQAITVYPTPSVNYGGTQSVLEGDSLVLNPVSISGLGLQYLWTPSLYLNSDTSSSPLCKPVNDITYAITVTSPGGCHASASLFVQILRDFTIPNTFTPNDDGINDTWIIENLPKYPIQWVQIFNRYGQLLFESHGYNHPWDGTYKGKPLPAGTYYYIIEVNGLRDPKTGYVTILR